MIMASGQDHPRRPPTTQRKNSRGQESLSAAIDDSLAALAERDEGREPVDLAAEVLLRMCGKALDMTMAQSNPYAVAQLAGRILELLRDLRMTPASRGALNTDGDPLDEIRHLLSSPEVRDPEEP